MLRTYVRNTYTHHLSEIFSTVVNEYTDWERTALHPINTRDATVAALSDAQFVAPLVQTGDAIYRVGPSSPVSNSGPASGPAAGPVAAIASSGGMGAILRTDGAGPFFYVFDYQTKEGDYPQVSPPPSQHAASRSSPSVSRRAHWKKKRISTTLLGCIARAIHFSCVLVTMHLKCVWLCHAMEQASSLQVYSNYPPEV